MSDRQRLGLFDAFGVELEYMLTDRSSLDVRPIADAVLADAVLQAPRAPASDSPSAEPPSDFVDGPVTWSNELALHVIELKATEPAADLRGLVPEFERAVRRITPLLARHQAALLPGAMHPWMDPVRETRLWPHAHHEIYEAFDRVFGCRSHGWANVQSVHLNLPFDGETEFGKLHAAVRVVLPLLPALAASSPIVEGQISGLADTRLEHYRHHCDRVPSIVGDVIPEPIFGEASYRQEIFERLYADIRPLDPSGHLAGEFLNARGAIARFDRGSIEIRVMDVQECPAADVALCAAATALVRALVEERWLPIAELQQIPTEPLARILQDTTRRGEKAVIEEPAVLAAIGASRKRWTAESLWQHLVGGLRRTDPVLDDLARPLDVIFEHGTLSRRILRAVGSTPTSDDLQEVYSQLAGCLRDGECFLP